MVKMLEGLKWSPKWVSHLGCIKGCLEYLKIDLSDTWLYGGKDQSLHHQHFEGLMPKWTIGLEDARTIIPPPCCSDAFY